MLPACDMLDKVGYYSLECWGGATYDACLRFLNEDPWERLRKLRKALPHTKTQMLLRGQNLLGYRPYSDDVVEFFVKKAVENGIDIIRCFDALNDLRNMETAVKATKKYGGIAEIAMSYTESPVHNEDYFVRLAQDIEKMGADIICIKDMANLLLPYKAYSLVKRLKKETSLPIVLHTHNTTGTGDMVLLKAIEAGVDVVDTCLSPLGSGTSQPATESLVATLKGTEYDTGFDLDLLAKLAEHFRWRSGSPDQGRLARSLPCAGRGRKDAAISGSRRYAVQPDWSAEGCQCHGKILRRAGGDPAGAQGLWLSAAGHAYLPDCGYAGGYERALRRALQDVPKESKGLLRGEYGKLPAPVNEAVRKQCIGDDKVITCRFADTLPPELDKLREEMREWYQCEEDVLTYAMFPKVAPKYFEYRQAQQMKIDSGMLDKADKTMPV